MKTIHWERQYVKPINKTFKEMQQLLQELQAIFPVARIIDPNMFRTVHINDVQDLHISPCHCYELWKKESRCHNCAAEKALRTKSQTIKLEYIESNVFQVIAQYVEIDHNPYVLELVYPLGGTLLTNKNTQRKLIQHLIQYDHKLYTDTLTGAYNRRYLEEQLKENCPAGGIAVIDIDDFKLYNDLYGHDVGDIVLKRIVKTIQSCIRRNDYLIRYGGDEFVLIMPYIAEQDLEQKLDAIKEKVHAIQFKEYEHLHVSISIGGVIYDGKHIEESLRQADKLMYKAKLHKDAVLATATAMDTEKTPWYPANSKDIRPLIVIADDSPSNRSTLRIHLGDTYRILEAQNGEEVLQLLQKYSTTIALILLDLVMPKMDGFEVLAYMREHRWYKTIPVMMISDGSALPDIRRAYHLGGIDYIRRPFDTLIIRRRVANMIMLYAKQRRLIKIIKSQIYERERNNRMMIDTLGQIIEFRNEVSGQHIMHITSVTRIILDKLAEKTQEYHLTHKKRSLIVTASAMHDIGKITISHSILNKPGPLTDEEFEMMKTHTVIGARMIQSLQMYKDEPLMRIAYEICRWHHERYDGKGYPDGLKGKEIPISAQVVSLADVYDALTSKRVYKEAYSHDKAISMIFNGECGSFNPLLLECLHDVKNKLQEELKVHSQIRNDAKEMRLTTDELMQLE